MRICGKKSRSFFRKPAALLSVLLCLSLPLCSQEYYSITADELEQIQLNAAQMMLTIEQQQTAIEKQKKATDEYKTLSETLRSESEKLTKSRNRWRAAAIGIGCGVVAGVGMAYLLRQ